MAIFNSYASHYQRILFSEIDSINPSTLAAADGVGAAGSSWVCIWALTESEITRGVVVPQFNPLIAYTHNFPHIFFSTDFTTFQSQVYNVSVLHGNMFWFIFFEYHHLVKRTYQPMQE